MGLSTERKVFVAILSIAGAALVIDQGLLGPSSADAAPPLPTEEATPLLAGIITNSSPSSSSQQSAAQILIDRLTKQPGSEKLAPQASLSTAFSLEELIEPVMEAVAQQGTPQVVESEPQERPTLPVLMPSNVSLPSLSAVMPAKSGGGAVLNGKLVRVGQVGPLGFTLKQVRERGVVLELDGRAYTVEIPMHTGP